MTNRQNEVDGPFGPVSRRSAIGSMLASAAMLAPAALSASQSTAVSQRPSTPRKPYDMKKSINLWAFPYPQRMTLGECLQLAKDAGFDGIELNYDLDNDLSPKAGHAGIPGDPPDGRPDRHRHQRPLLVPLLAVSADEQRRGEARARPRAGRPDGAGGARPRHREPARRSRRGAHPLARRSRAGPERRLRSPRARSRRHAREDRRKAQGLT